MLTTATIVGSDGKMGALFTRLLTRAGMTVRGLDRPLAPEAVRPAVAGADLVVLAVPVPAMDEVVAAVAPFLDPSTILADICSLKTLPVKAMCSGFAGPVVGTHPLFGPEPDPADMTCCLTPGRDEHVLPLLEELFTACGMTLFTATAEEHDRAMAYIQGLNFVTTLSYLSCLPEDVDIDRFLTPSFKRRLNAAKTMVTRDAALFATLFDSNPYSGESVRNFRSFLNVAAGGDLDLLTEKALWWWRTPENQGGPPA
jgi:prephenate dehydrogenase